MSQDLFGIPAWIEDCSARQHRAYLLIDGALNEGQQRKLQAMRVGFVSLFEGSPEDVLLDIAPWLIELTQLATTQRLALIKWAGSLGRQRPCLSWYESACERDAFARHLRHFHYVGLSDDQIMLMRWYDTRILPVWLQVLTHAQRQLFAGCINHIACVDAEGIMRVLHANPAAGHPLESELPDAPLLELDDQQFGLLLEARALDTLMYEIGLRAPGRWHRLPHRRLLEFVSQHRDLALGAGLKDQERQLYYVLLAVFTSGKAAQHPAVVELMKAPPTEAAQFIEAIKQLPGEVFVSGEPLWMSEMAPDEPGPWHE
ncbi:hypothetical protein RB25_03610 [Herbaspirillum rubrisubalbicans]|uniref:DUF4123 domain-containing protein n=1 Tax=Herbaspirillum rubrisubalbicans TaxID=80842 RepID=A0ABX9C2B2_9BURK|nr:DUF4123 domain-containing protein [Herbaspirillum rubrisubalbicans]RAM64604.1 hypothetical protein RB24_10410 [Herbaspirillum rubrisubalbicans]RAN49948.1 hypothetical protein RB25_03610 [Herbaspirillum rubrisubalbicans]